MSDPVFRISPFAPANETLSTIHAERLDINGYILGAVGYGVHSTLFFLCFSLLLKRLRMDAKSSRSSQVFLAYITLNFVLGSIGNAINCLDNEQEFVDDRGFPGGPEGFEAYMSTSFQNIFGAVIYIINTWSQDGMLLYRFCTIFDYNLSALILPSIAYFGSIIMSCLYLATLPRLMTPFGANVTNFGLAFWSLSIGTTILLTISIVVHLLRMRYQIVKVLGSARGSPYVSISAMFMESALIYSAVGLFLLVCFAKKYPAQTLVFPLLGQVQSIAPLLIILRVAQGQAVERDTFKQIGTTSTTLEFSQQTNQSGNAFRLSALNASVTKNSSTEYVHKKDVAA